MGQQYWFEIGTLAPTDYLPLEHLGDWFGVIVPILERNMDGREPVADCEEIGTDRPTMSPDGVEIELSIALRALAAMRGEPVAEWWQSAIGDADTIVFTNRVEGRTLAWLPSRVEEINGAEE